MGRGHHCAGGCFSPLKDGGAPISLIGSLIYRKRWTIRDAGGRSVRVFEPAPHVRRGGVGDLGWGEFRLLQRAAFGSRWNDRRVLWGFIRLLLAISVVSAWIQHWPKFPVFHAAECVIGLGVIALCRGIEVGSDPVSLARALVSRGRCGSCTYPLPGTVDDHGRTICSECGAAWNRRAAVSSDLPQHPPK